MSKFKVSLKIQGFELEIEGVREDASLISRNIGEQISSMLTPAGQIISGNGGTRPSKFEQIESLPIINTNPKKNKRKQASSNGGSDGGSAIDFQHPPETFGNPRQEWKTADKSLWLVYVIGNVAGAKGLSTKTIVETFNKHFRQSGAITTSNVTRDLGRLKTKERPSPIGEDTTKSPSEWFLTDEGNKRAGNLVLEALGRTNG